MFIFFLFFLDLGVFCLQKNEKQKQNKKKGDFHKQPKIRKSCDTLFLNEWAWMLSEHSKTKKNHISETFQDSATVFQPKKRENKKRENQSDTSQF